MKKIIFFLFLFTNTIYAESKLDSLITRLEEEMLKRKDYDKSKELRILNIKDLLEEKNTTIENKYFLTDKLISEYEYYSFDSTLCYIEKNIKLAHKIDKPYFLQEATLKLAKLLATSGRYKESIDVLNDIDKSNLPEKILKDYYHTYRRCYSELIYFSKVESNKNKYKELFKAYKDSLDYEVSKLDENSLYRLASEEEKMRDGGNIEKALELNNKRLSLVKFGTRDYSTVAYEKSYTNASFFGDGSFEHKKYLILAAISDIQSSVKDNAALTDLAVNLFKEGDVDKAHKYIDFSFEDANFYNSQLRYIQISSILPVISKSYEESSIVQRTKLKRSLIFISILSIILISALFYIFRQFKKLKTARNKLKEVNIQLKDLNDKLSFTNNDLKKLYEKLSDVDRIKEQYIGTFLNLYSDYIDKLDVYRKTVRKYLVTNKINALLELTESKQVVEKELKLFYSNFDKSFLHIYPNFINDFNTLLKEEEKIVVKKGEILNTELRVFALIRLGITNSSKIAKILRYSVNTIYNYRVKMKNNAIDRDNFEKMVKNIS